MSHLHHEGGTTAAHHLGTKGRLKSRGAGCVSAQGWILGPSPPGKGELISGRRELSVIRGLQAGPGGPLVNGEVWLDSPESLQGM